MVSIPPNPAPAPPALRLHRRDALRPRRGPLFGGSVARFVMPPKRALDVDTELDLQPLERIPENTL